MRSDHSKIINVLSAEPVPAGVRESTVQRSTHFHDFVERGVRGRPRDIDDFVDDCLDLFETALEELSADYVKTLRSLIGDLAQGRGSNAELSGALVRATTSADFVVHRGLAMLVSYCAMFAEASE